MKSLKTLALAAFAFALFSCGGDKKSDSIPTASSEGAAATEAPATQAAVDPATYDPKRGLGPHENVDVSKFDPAMAAAGKKIAEVKCTSCHKPTEEKLVGPGWKGVTKRQTPEWIMNFISNPDPMIDVDPELQKQLELCLVRMPNQGLNEKDAREVLEYMREIDGAK
ncbi:c-type cytochrome [Chryseobacterium sp. R2A-55]|uniref:c-type cytochrome n=1 Tax=Chryseobacterium sp. R2A-55 TaxID=2744445 RepID=UPI001F19C827|nr:cytochrome c [Chryseobacterium sp. R2A-55]